MNKSQIILLLSFFLSACASTPQIKQDSTISLKNISFPKAGEELTRKKNDLVMLNANYESKHVYKLTKPVKIGFMLGSISASSDNMLDKAVINNKAAYCSKDKVYFDPLVGPYAIACFYGNTEKFVDTVTAAPGAIWFDKKLNSTIDIIQSEIPIATGNILKRELFYIGRNGNTILFNMKVYDKSVDMPSVITPLVFTLPEIPYLIEIEGAKLNIVGYDENQLKYIIIKNW